MSAWWTAQALAGLNGMPAYPASVRKKAEREEWQSRDREQGKGLEHHISSLPAETRRYLTEQAVAEQGQAVTMQRHGLLRDGSESALNHYVERQTVRLNNGIGVAEVGWLSEHLAYSVLESLKHWHRRAMVEALQAAKKTVPINEKTGRVAGYQAVLAAFEQMQAEVQHG